MKEFDVLIVLKLTTLVNLNRQSVEIKSGDFNDANSFVSNELSSRLL